MFNTPVAINSQKDVHTPATAGSSNSQKLHQWGAFSSQDSHLLDAVSNLARKNPQIKAHMDTLSKSGKVEVRISMKAKGDFKHSLNKLLDESPQTVKYCVQNNAETSGIYVRELPRAEGEGSQKASEKAVVELVCTTSSGSLPSEEHFEGMTAHLARHAETGKWPPIFAVLERPPVSDRVGELKTIPLGQLQKLNGSLVHDLGGKDFKRFEGGGRQVGPIITAKVASGDTLMLQYALEREVRPGDVVFIDGGKFTDDGKNASYANVGGLLREIAIQKGAKGFVVEGFIRDSGEYNSTDGTFFCYAKGVTPNGPTKLEAGAIHLPVQGNGYSVKSSDICISEGDHVFVIPSENIDAVIRGAKSEGESVSKGKGAEVTEAIPGKSDEYHISFEGTDGTAPKNDLPEELRGMLEHAPTAEFADSYSTREPAETVGLSIRPAPDAERTTSAGAAVVAGGSRDTIEQGIQVADDKTTLFVPASSKGDVSVDSALVRSAAEKKLQAIATNGTAALSEKPAIPVYAKNFVAGDEPLASGQNVLHRPVTIEGVNVRPGDAIVGDEDGLAVIPKGTEEFGLRGAHAIKSKEDSTIIKIRTGTAAPRDLPHEIYPSTDSINAPFLRAHIDGRDAPVQTARGSSGLAIPRPAGVRVSTIKSSSADQHTRDALIQKLKSDEGTSLSAGDTVKGKPGEIIFNAADPVVVQMTKSSRVPLKSEKETYVSGLEGNNFRQFMVNKEEGKKVSIDGQGTVKPVESTARRLSNAFQR